MTQPKHLLRAMLLAARAAPDGYTLFLGGVGSHAINPNLHRHPAYDPVRDFAPVSLLHTEIVKVLAEPDVRKALASEGADPVGSSPEEFAAHIKSEVAKWRKVIVEADIRPE